ncbi:ATP-grasp fold amidoligase family protein [Clostridium perfringens]|uniref:ATP-grasp fold amidoligase family protein n=1 Tax=Clostridium perfringens TaxID=1502 RepID=UPI0001665FFC|nr:ATP-grasp fold amidoligase family protein [Clostridium perfringens]AXH51539.1 glycosyl transferase [Clostridium perfringens]EDS81047.1 glycosyltransferase [Clostridium perfringens C str. JGS1495]MBI6030579.1 glycosyl transferase [Clostridium perfringens]MBI6033845.1 glycosyl transferase [Clostridium perfringens]NGT46715.1 glycosyl transferase [Clostridium perfringens]
MKNKIIKAITCPSKIILYLLDVHSNWLWWMSDKTFLSLKFKFKVGKKLDLSNPRTFSEKLQWLKINDRKQKYIKMVDKYEVKKYVSEVIGEKYIIPTLGVWDNVEEIDWEKLPQKFVLKCTHDSGGLVICKDKSSLNIDMAKKKLSKFLKRNFYLIGREWPYKNVQRKIIAEKYLGDSKDDILNISDLADYKFFCFYGEPSFCQVILDRSINETIDFFDMEWEKCVFSGLVNKYEGFEHSKKDIPKPRNFDKMKLFSKMLSKDIPFSRIDFYEIDGSLYFGEITLYPASGFGEFFPLEWNNKIGDMINLTTIID